MNHIQLQAGSCRSDRVIKSTRESFIQPWGYISIICLRFHKRPQRGIWRNGRTSNLYRLFWVLGSLSAPKMIITNRADTTAGFPLRLLDAVAVIDARAAEVVLFFYSFLIRSFLKALTSTTDTLCLIRLPFSTCQLFKRNCAD